MTLLERAALLGCVSMLATTLGFGTAAAETARAAQRFDIPSKPLLAALADYTAATGVQVVRPGAQRLDRAAPALSGEHDPEAALQKLLAGSGLVAEFVGPRSATLRPVGAALVPMQLAGDGTPLDEIDVQGTGLREGGVGQIAVTEADIARKNPVDVKQLFAGEPSVSVGGSIPLSQKVYVNGIEENNLAVTIDGSAQNNKVFHHNATTVIDPALMKQARVDPGVAPADAGFGALAGAIAYETKDVGDLLEGDGVGGSAKSWFNTNGNVFGSNLSVYGKQNGFEALGSFNFADGKNYKSGAGDRVAGTSADLLSGLAKFAYEADSGDRFEFSHERVHDDAPRPFRANLGSVGRPGEPPVRDYRLDRQNSVFTYTDATPEGWWDPKIVLAYSATRLKVPIFEIEDRTAPIPNYVNTYSASGKTSSLNGRAENKFALGMGSVTAGVDFRNDKATLDDFYGDAREKMTNVGVYAQARLEPIERARLSFGGRGDYQKFDGVGDGVKRNDGGLSANASGEYDLIADFLTAKVGYSHVWAGVPLAENFLMNPAWVYGPLKATTADNAKAGLVARSNGFTVEGGIFRTKIKNARAARYSNFFDPDGPNGPDGAGFGATFAPDVLSRGFEIGAGYAWDQGFVRVKYAHIDVDINGRRADSDIGYYIATPVGDIITVSAAHTFAPWNVTIGGDVEIAPKYDRTGVNFYATGVAPGQSFPRYPAYKAYQIVNAFLEWKPTFTRFETTFRIDAKNIFDETYSSRATYGSEFGNVTPLFEPGRAVILSAAVKF